MSAYVACETFKKSYIKFIPMVKRVSNRCISRNIPKVVKSADLKCSICSMFVFKGYSVNIYGVYDCLFALSI